MLALDAKRGLEATLERVLNASGQKGWKLDILWSGKTAGVRFEGRKAHIILPAVDETKDVPVALFNDLLGYVLHELGHIWFTQNEPWDLARLRHGAYVSNLINGLEDPRIEWRVIKSGYAPNSRALFESLVNNVLEDGYVEPDDFKNLPFQLAIEGRRLNGYNLDAPSVLDESRYAADLRWALTAAQKAKTTAQIAKIAIELYRRLKKAQAEKPEDKPEDKPEPKGKPEGKPESGEGEGEDEGKGEDGGKGQDEDEDEDEGEGQGQGKEEGEDEGEGEGEGQDEGEDDPHPDGQGEEVGRGIEPDEKISSRFTPLTALADEFEARPSIGKPTRETIFYY
jgi:hypothetical protein